MSARTGIAVHFIRPGRDPKIIRVPSVVTYSCIGLAGILIVAVLTVLIARRDGFDTTDSYRSAQDTSQLTEQPSSEAPSNYGFFRRYPGPGKFPIRSTAAYPGIPFPLP